MFINELVLVSVFLLIFITNQHRVWSILIEPFYWNQTTFRPYRNGQLAFEVRSGDVMDLVCPFYDEQRSYMASELEQYDIYRVTENEYDMCNVYQLGIDPLTRLVISCNSPYDVMKYTLNFRPYLPIPNGFEFRSNQTYYFLSTSSNQKQCDKVKIVVHDNHYRGLSSTSTVSIDNNYQRKPLSFPHYSHHRHPSSLFDNEKNDDKNRPFFNAIKAQRHSDPYSIQWITEWPQQNDDHDKSQRSTNPSGSSVSPPSNILSLALSSSSSTISISIILILQLLIVLR